MGIAAAALGLATRAHAGMTYDFNADAVGATPSAWYVTTDSWGNASSAWKVAADATHAGNQALDETNTGGFSTLATTLTAPLSDSWTATFDYAWHWGDGNANYGVGISLRTPTGANNGYDGYRYMIYMGDGVDGGVGKQSAARFQIETYNGNNIPTYNANTLLAAGSDGSTDTGYASNTDWGTPAGIGTMNHGKLTWDAGTGTLTAYYLPAGGAGWTQEAQAMDLSTTSFSEVALSYVGSGAWPAVDNLVITTVPEPASCGLVLAGMGGWLLRRRACRRGGVSR